MPITRVESLVYGIADMASGIRYYQDWGLETVEQGERSAVFKTPSGPNHSPIVDR